ncbi:MAG TPA: hypothetical protein VJH88_06150 [Candidatus Nanoarchaeia archaeon]|nr:hypothetical protein [Candidatus Nanoarchaeia archaeon]
MQEARAIIQDIEKAKIAVEAAGAMYKGNYKFRDVIFKENDSDDDILRMRIYIKSNWPTRKVSVIRKKTEFNGLIQKNKVILKLEFESESEALEFMSKKIAKSLIMKAEYVREGWEYQLKSARIFIEDIKGWKPTVEIEAETAADIENIFDKIEVIKRLHESVPEIMCRLQERNNN